MSELIRRQDAELILAREMYATSLEDGCDPVSPMDFLPEARAWLSDAPTIGGWISCSERLPKEYGCYLITTNDGRVDLATFGNTKDEKVWSSCDASGFYWLSLRGIEVVAWMPLPEPYEAS